MGKVIFNTKYMEENLRWYQKNLIIILLAFGGFVVLFVALFGFITIKYWRQIKSGQAKYLQQEFYGDFNRSIKTTASTESKINRKELETEDDPFLGNPSAEIVIVEFIDFKCPNCKKSASITKKLFEQYGYKIKLIVRDFPAISIHPGADKLSEIAYCAHEQGRFWKMYDILFDNQVSLPSSLTNNDIKNLASSASVDFNKLTKCLSLNKAKIEVNKDYADGFKFGVKGTPTFFVNGQKVEGVVPLDAWKKFLDQ